MKTHKILNIAILALAIGAAVCFGAAFVQNRTFGGTAQKMIGYIVDHSEQVMFDSEEDDSLVEEWLKRSVGESAKSLSEEYLRAINGLLLLFRVGFLLPAVLAVATAALVWAVKARWKYLAAFGTALVGAAIFPGVEILAVPLSISGHFQKSGLLDWVSDSVHWTTFCKIAAEFTDGICWVGFGVMIGAAALCLMGFFVKEEKETAQQKAEEKEIPEPVLTGLAGAYAGGVIPLRPGEKLILGKDTKVCNLILSGEGIAPVHCSIEYVKEQNQYAVEDQSETGTYTNENLRLSNGQRVFLERNSLLVLGSDENIFMLE